MAVLFFAIPTAVFAYLEPSWGVLDAFYYCFISLTTIGLGDYIPGEGVSIDNRSIYKMIITAYLVFGKWFNSITGAFPSTICFKFANRRAHATHNEHECGFTSFSIVMKCFCMKAFKNERLEI